MERLGAALGGEQSGHLIFREYATTGDGLLTALRLFEIARRAGVGWTRLTADLEVYPQRLVNVRVREKKELTELPSVAREIQLVEEAFGGAGRVLVRFSGTEPLARVMWKGRTWNKWRASARASQRSSGGRWGYRPHYSRAASRHQTRFSQGVGSGVAQLEAKMK